jgi:RNA recognition motif-containing protein
MNIFVGNLSQTVTEDDLRQAFGSFGPVTEVKIIKDRYTSESKGFGFVEMSETQDAKSAITKLNDTDLKGKTITVNEAKPRSSDSRNSGGRPKSGVWQNRY